MALAQRCGDSPLQYVQAVVQIFAKTFLLDGGLKVDVRRRQNPHIHRNRLTAADALDAVFLQEAQQIGLQLQGQIADFIEKQVPPFAASIRPTLR